MILPLTRSQPTGNQQGNKPHEMARHEEHLVSDRAGVEKLLLSTGRPKAAENGEAMSAADIISSAGPYFPR